MDLGYYLQYQILRQGPHSGPVLDIGAELDLYALVCHTMGIEDTVLVNIAIEMIFVFSEISIEVRCGSQHTLVGCSGCDGTGIHQSYGSDLAVLQLGAFTVREISGRVTDTECVIGRRITGTEAGTTERSLHDCTGL